VRGVLSLALGPRHLVPGGVLLAFQALHLWNQPTAMGLERGQLLQLGAGVEAPRLEPLPHLVEMVTDENRVKHDWSALF